jgi:hypothetical protein
LLVSCRNLLYWLPASASSPPARTRRAGTGR